MPLFGSYLNTSRKNIKTSQAETKRDWTYTRQRQGLGCQDFFNTKTILPKSLVSSWSHADLLQIQRNASINIVKIFDKILDLIS